MEHASKQVNAVHERDLKSLLRRLNLLERFNSGSIKCKFCEIAIHKENMYSFFRESGGINFVCNKPFCITESLMYLSEKGKSRLEN